MRKHFFHVCHHPFHIVFGCASICDWIAVHSSSKASVQNKAKARIISIVDRRESQLFFLRALDVVFVLLIPSKFLGMHN